MINRKIVYVRWLDHQENDESTAFDEEVGPATFHTVAFLTGEHEDWIEVSRDIQIENGEPIEKVSALCILKKCILSLAELK